MQCLYVIFYMLKFMYVATLKNFKNKSRKFDIHHDLHVAFVNNIAIFPVC